MFVITVRFTVKPGSEERFYARVQRQASVSLSSEAGCRQFDVARGEDDPCRVFLYEVYDDVAAFNAHLRTAHFAEFDQETQAWIAEKRVDRWIG